MKRFSHSSFILPALLFTILLTLLTQCRKEKTVRLSGTLLLSKKYPVPIANRTVEITQAGSPGTPVGFGSTGAFKNASTDANGRFDLTIERGTSYFLIFAGTNKEPLCLRSADNLFPPFSQNDLFDSLYNSAIPVYIGKIIGTGNLYIRLSTDLLPSDTLVLKGQNISGFVSKEFTGLSGPAGIPILIDTLQNLLFTHYDAHKKRFFCSISLGKKDTNTLGSPFIRYLSNYQDFSTEDEVVQDIFFYGNP